VEELMDETDPVDAAPQELAEPSEASEPSEEAELLLNLAERLTGVEGLLADFHRRSAHRETVIDRLHEENQTYRSGLRRSILDPVVADLFRLYDGLQKEARRLEDDPQGRLLASFADEAELILDRCGVEAFSPKPGDPFEPARHNPAGTAPTDDPALHNTVETVLSTGFLDQEGGRIRRPAKARFWQHVPPQTPEESE
jgi:molecular chaperone GrpE